ncbi:MAG: O-antigen ligase family protein [Polyangiaceae bacterium]|nr:O-antigen ligase family protein [Polyangiaceae bacterium]
MKYLLFAIAYFSIFVLGFFGRGRRGFVQFLAWLLTCLLWVELPSIQFFADLAYRGTDQGFEITAIDLVAWLLFFLLPKGVPGPYRKVQVAYFAMAFLAVFFSEMPLYGAFTLWKLLRLYVFVVVVWRLCQEEQLILCLLNGLALGMLLEAGLCLKLRYVDHMHQVAGTFPHQNSLGMALNLALPILLLRYLSTGHLLSVAGLLAGCLALVLTLSRGSIFVGILGLILAFLTSFLYSFSVRKVFLSVMGATVLLLLGAKSADSIRLRFQHAPEASGRARDLFEDAASLMVEDHPGGVGLNLYSYYNHQLYGQRVGLPAGDMGGVAHNIYWLTIAELGWLGLACLLLQYFFVMLVALWGAWRGRWTAWGPISAGCAIGLGTMYIQGFFEWVARQTVQSYFFWLVAVVALAASRVDSVSPCTEESLAVKREVRQRGLLG